MASIATAPKKTIAATASIHHQSFSMSRAGPLWGVSVDWPPQPASDRATTNHAAEANLRALRRRARRRLTPGAPATLRDYPQAVGWQARWSEC
jgi:hypothetical protein